jgi:hypothetical protein
MKKINESLDYHDFVGEVLPKISVDEYAAKMGKDKDVVTVAFTVKSKLCGKDLISWLEGGYDFILDAALSTGEVADGRWLVFVEMDRRTAVPERIIEMLEDLEPLTALNLDNWTVKVNDKEYGADKDVLKDAIILSPKEYKRIKRKEEKENELNDMRDIAGLDHPSDEEETEEVQVDAELKEFINRAGL